MLFNKSSLSRRHVLSLGTGLAGGIALAGIADNYLIDSSEAVVDDPKRDFSVTENTTLKQRAAAKGLIYGAAAVKHYLNTDSNLATNYAQQCGIIVSDVDLKWDALRPAPDQFKFGASDWLVKFAKDRGMLFRGHTLVWEQQLPKWFKEVVNSKNAENFLVEHINTVVKRYAGQTHSWDVVNEAIAASESQRPDGLSNSPWLQLLGEDYIDLAFRTAAAADPNTLLVYNERRLDYDGPKSNAQREAVLKLLQRLRSKGTPIHALGIQAHLDGSQTLFNPTKVRNFLKDVASLGLKIMITELDVSDSQLPADFAVRDRIVASAYEDYLSVVLDQPAVVAVLTWGLSDRYTWLSTVASRPDNRPVRPLPLDYNFKRKLAWNAIARAFDQAPKR